MASENLEIIITAKDRTQGILKNIGGGLAGIGKIAAGALAVGIGAATAGVGALGYGIFELTKTAAELGPIKKSFEGIAEASGVAGEAMLRALQEGSGGLISNIDLMKTYNLASQLVSSQFANELPDAMEYVSKVSAATGASPVFI